MPLQNIQRSDPIVQGSWDSGMITSLPPEELPEDAAAFIKNYEFDDTGNLRGREPSVAFASLPDSNVISSLFHAKFSNGTEFFVYTSGTSLFTMDTAGVSTDRTGAFSFPAGTRWYWRMFDDFAIGVMGSSTQRPIKISSAAAVTTLNASAPFASRIEVWNSRLWLSGINANGTGNTLFASAINDPEDWTTTGDAGAITLGVDINDGDSIFALSVFRGNLFPYKERSIHVVSAISAPATIPSNLRVDLYTRNFGTRHQLTVQNVLDDQLFLSRSGVVSLTLAPLGDIAGAVISNNLIELDKLFPGNEGPNSSPTSIVIKQKQQYWLAIPDGIVPNSTTEYRLFVCDFSDINQKDVNGFPKVRWCVFDEDVYGSAYTEWPSDISGLTSYIISRVTSLGAGLSFVRYTGLSDNYNTTSISRQLLTRAYGDVGLRSLWYRFGMTFKKITSDISMKVNYYFNNSVDTPAGSYNHLSLSSVRNHNTLWKGFRKNGKGRKASLAQLEIIQNGAANGLILKSFSLEKTLLNHRRSKDAEIMANEITTINRDISVVGNITTGLDTLHSFTLVANSLANNGDYLKVRYGGTFATNDNDKRIQISFGGQVVDNTALFDQDGGVWDYDLTFVRFTATQVKITGTKSWGSISRDGAGTAAGNANISTIFTAITVPDLSSNSMIMLVEAEATATNDVQQGLSVIELSVQQ